MSDTEPLTALQAAPLFKAILAVDPPPKWSNFDRDFLNEMVTFGARCDHLSLSAKQSNILIRMYYACVLAPRLPTRSPEGQIRYADTVAKLKTGGRVGTSSRLAPRRRDMQDANEQGEPPF